MNDSYATAPTPTTIRIERKLPGPIERVWSYLVDGEKRALWFAGGAFELKPGGVANIEMDHRRLSHEPTPEAWQGFDGMKSTGTITRVDPPRLLAWSFAGENGNSSELTFELTPQGKDVLLVLTQTELATAKGKANYSQGWHAHLAILEDRLNGVKPRGFWTYFDSLESGYASRF